jgi:hypothetical protein
MALTVLQTEQIAGLLREVPGFVDGLQARRPGLAGDVVEWLRRAESALENNRLPAVSHLATLRAQLIEAERGVQTTEVTFAGRPTTRKIREATVGVVLERSSDVLHGVIGSRQTVFDEAERITAQLVVVAGAKGLVAKCAEGSQGEALSCLQQSMAGDPDLASGYAHLLSLVGTTDIVIFLDRALARLA